MPCHVVLCDCPICVVFLSLLFLHPIAKLIVYATFVYNFHEKHIGYQYTDCGFILSDTVRPVY